jgi:hypothetical protein
MESTVIHHMVDDIINGQQSDALSKFNEIVASKLSDALEARKIEIASSLGKEQEHHEEV